MSEGKGATSTEQLEGYQVLLKTAKGGAAVSVIKEALKNPGLFVFGELIDMPNVLELEKNPEHKPWLDVFKIFAYGTYQDFKAKSKDLPALTPVQIEKLKQLTLVSLASKSKTLSYPTLIEALELKDVRELEDLIIDTVYIGLVKGKLDQKKQVFEVEFAIGRDIGPTDVSQMMATISAWSKAAEELMSNLDKNMGSAIKSISEKKKEEEDIEKQRKDIVEAIKIQRETQGGEMQSAAMMSGMMGGGDRRGPSKRSRKMGQDPMRGMALGLMRGAWGGDMR